MKKLLLLGLLAGAYTLPAAAQLNLGVKAGLNLASLSARYKGSGPKIEAFTNKPSYHAGLIGQVPITGPIAFQAEVLLSAKGGKFDLEGAGDVSLYYVSVPLLAVFKPVPLIGLEAGVELSYLASAWQEVHGRSLNKAGEYKDSDIGLIGGVQVNYHRFNADVRYVYGLTKISESTVTGVHGLTSHIKYNNTLVQISVGYFFLKRDSDQIK